VRRICEYIISALALFLISFSNAWGQDTLFIPLKVNVGLEVMGPVNYFINKDVLSTEGYISVDWNEKRSYVLSAGYLDYKYSQYNYTYLNKGFFIRIGPDFNILKPKKSQGKYWGGIGFRYGLSHYQWQVPSLHQTNYFGETTSSIPSQREWGHFLEASPGMRAEIFPHFSMGWSVSLRMLIRTGSTSDLKPIYFPGYGNAAKRFSTGFSYFIVWNIPYKKIRVITKKEEPEETDETDDVNNNQNQNSPGYRQNQQQQSPMDNMR
jgi:hypothetical protein